MSIFIQELKKLFQPKTVLFSVVVAVLLSLPMLWSLLATDRFGVHEKELLEFAKEINEKYGPTISDDEMQAIRAEAQKLREEYSGQSVMSGRATYYQMAVQSWDNLLEVRKAYPTVEENPFIGDDVEGELYEKHVYESGEGYRSWFVPEIRTVTSTYYSHVTIILAVLLFILVAPLRVRDRMMGVEQQQLPSKIGRSIYGKQYLAVLLSAFGVTTLGMVIFGGLFLRHGTWQLWKNSMDGFFNGMTISMEYGTWWLLLLLMAYLFLMGLAGCIYFVTGLSKNYVDMIVKCIPVAVVGIVLISFSMDHFLDSENQIVGIVNTYASLWYSVVVAVIVFVVGICLGAISCRRGKKAEE